MTDNSTAMLYRARKRPLHRHTQPVTHTLEADGNITSVYACGHPWSAESAKRGKNNRARGNRIELEVARSLGLRKVGMFGGPEDVGTRDDPFLIQVKSKSGRAYPEWVERELARLPVTAQQTPLLVIAEAGVVGKRRRALVVLRMDDWLLLHGPAGEVA